MKKIVALAGFVAFGMLGCGGDETGEPPFVSDAGHDADAGRDSQALLEGGNDAADAGDVDAGEDAGPCPGMTDAGFSFGEGATCDDCMGRSCCSETSACLSNADCKALLVCVSGCQDSDGGTACIDECKTNHSAGLVGYASVSDCRSSVCGTECP